jgi:hypothetical protein
MCTISESANNEGSSFSNSWTGSIVNVRLNLKSYENVYSTSLQQNLPNI